MKSRLKCFLIAAGLLLGACDDGPTSPNPLTLDEAGPSSTIGLPGVTVTACQFGGTYPNC